MTSAAEPKGEYDLTRVPMIVQGGVKLGLLESIFVLLSPWPRAFWAVRPSHWSRRHPAVGLAAVTCCLDHGLGRAPSRVLRGPRASGWRPAWFFCSIDVTLLQNIGTYTHRWYDIGGGSNWWYHPVWWMAGPSCPGWGHGSSPTRRKGGPSLSSGGFFCGGAAVVCAVVAILLGFPGARWTAGHLRHCFLPGTRPGDRHFPP